MFSEKLHYFCPVFDHVDFDGKEHTQLHIYN